jgi:STAS domain-containing protein
MSADHASPLSAVTASVDPVTLIVVDGVLDSSTYLRMRDAVIKAALDEPRAVVVDVSALSVPAESAWAVFTSARWHVNVWPDVPIVLVCAHAGGRHTIARNGITRYVPVYANTKDAVSALDAPGRHGLRRRARAQLAADRAALDMARELVADWLSQWGHDDLITVAGVVATVFVENVLAHTEGPPTLRLECDGVLVTVAVEDASSVPAQRLEHPRHGADVVSGLAMVSALSRVWGTAPTPNGKTVWAVIGPENQL